MEEVANAIRGLIPSQKPAPASNLVEHLDALLVDKPDLAEETLSQDPIPRPPLRRRRAQELAGPPPAESSSFMSRRVQDEASLNSYCPPSPLSRCASLPSGKGHPVPLPRSGRFITSNSVDCDSPPIPVPKAGLHTTCPYSTSPPVPVPKAGLHRTSLCGTSPPIPIPKSGLHKATLCSTSPPVPMSKAGLRRASLCSTSPPVPVPKAAPRQQRLGSSSSPTPELPPLPRRRSSLTLDVSSIAEGMPVVPPVPRRQDSLVSTPSLESGEEVSINSDDYVVITRRGNRLRTMTFREEDEHQHASNAGDYHTMDKRSDRSVNCSPTPSAYSQLVRSSQGSLSSSNRSRAVSKCSLDRDPANSHLSSGNISCAVSKCSLDRDPANSHLSSGNRSRAVSKCSLDRDPANNPLGLGNRSRAVSKCSSDRDLANSSLSSGNRSRAVSKCSLDGGPANSPAWASHDASEVLANYESRNSELGFYVVSTDTLDGDRSDGVESLWTAMPPSAPHVTERSPLPSCQHAAENSPEFFPEDSLNSLPEGHYVVCGSRGEPLKVGSETQNTLRKSSCPTPPRLDNPDTVLGTLSKPQTRGKLPPKKTLRRAPEDASLGSLQEDCPSLPRTLTGLSGILSLSRTPPNPATASPDAEPSEQQGDCSTRPPLTHRRSKRNSLPVNFDEMGFRRTMSIRLAKKTASTAVKVDKAKAWLKRSTPPMT